VHHQIRSNDGEQSLGLATVERLNDSVTSAAFASGLEVK